MEVDHDPPNGLALVRHYNSSLPGWVHNWGMRVLANNAIARVIRPDGRAYDFTGGGPGEWTTAMPVAERLVKLNPAGPSQPAWQYTSADDTVEWFDAQGYPVRIAPRGGRVYNAVFENGLLRRIVSDLGAALYFQYDAQQRLAQVTTSDGVIEYGYDLQGRLASVRYPTGHTRQYLYENTQYPLALTGIVDERGVRYATWAYDASGRAVSSEYAGGVERFRLSFDAGDRVSIEDPLGSVRQQGYTTVGTRKLLADQSQPCANCSGNAASRDVEPATGLLAQSLDYLGVATLFAHDPLRRLPLEITRAANRPEQRKTNIQWHATFRLPVQVVEAGRAIAFTYDDNGNKLSEVVTDTATGQTRSRSWTYTPQGLADTETDARGGVWRFTHDAQGNRTGVKNPQGEETRYTHDAAGRVLTQASPNRPITTLTWDARGRLLSQAVGSEVTTYAYTPTGQLQRVTMPNGRFVDYSFDAAQRLTGAADSEGNTIAFTLDAAGNRIREETRDATGSIALLTARVINSLGKVAAIQGAQGQTTQTDYDANGEAISQTDPLNQTTRQTLDGLRRSTATTFADNTSAQQSWNPLDQLTQVIDPKGVATQYAYNAFGEVTSETSPDMGTINYTRDARGDVTGIENANGQITRIERDALGRPTRLEYAASHVAHLSYDSAGDITRVEDPSGSTLYERDEHGRVIARTQAVNDNPANPSPFKVLYGYTHGDLTSLTYPSGLKIFYRRMAGRITGIDVQEPGGTVRRPKPVMPFITQLTHTPLGQPKAWAWASGDSASRTYDADGRMVSNEFASYIYDAASRITGITQHLWASSTATGTVTSYTTPLNWTVGYDSRNRLTRFNRPGAETSYTYDANSNRLTAIDKTTSDIDLDGDFDNADFSKTTNQNLTIESTSNRLLGFTQTLTHVRGTRTVSTASNNVNYTVDAAGNLTSDGLRSFEYDAANRLSSARILKEGEAASIRYLHNVLGQRVFKGEPTASQTLPSETDLGTSFIDWLKKNFKWLYASAQANTSIGTAYVYGDGEIPSWALLGEYDNGSAKGAGRSEFIWLPSEGGSAIPIGMFRNGKLFAIHSDHLGTPRLMTNELNQPVWQWPYSAFGNNKPTGILKATPNPKAALTNVPELLKATAATEMGLRMPGQLDDPETGTFQNIWRSYWAVHGRYTQNDPIGLDGGWNRFGYVGGNPLSRVDPSGLITICVNGVCTNTSPPPYNPRTDSFTPAPPSWGFPSLPDWMTPGPTYAKPPDNAYDPLGPKAPGKPGKAEGFKDPKGGENWVRNPNGRGYGWQGSDGGVWCPTGPDSGSTGDAHGGPHWDVQYPGGSHENVYPGGRRR